MKNKLCVAAVFFLPTAIFAQHGVGFHGGMGTGFGLGTGGFGSAGLGFNTGRFGSTGFGGTGNFTNGRRFFGGRRFDNGFFYPFYPVVDNLYSPLAENFPAAADVAPQSCSTTVVQPAAPVVPAHPVIHDYTWNNQPSTGEGDEATFTIVLKDGSRRSAVTAWVQDGSLHYIDAQDRQEVLSSNLIDRDATQRSNREKNLHMQLPPG